MSKYRVITDQGAYEVTTEDPLDSSMGDVAMQAGKEATATLGGYQPDTAIGQLATDPVTQAKALPYLASAAAGGTPGLGTVAMAGGRLLSDAALASYGKSDQIPSLGDQAKEIGTTALLDLPRIPIQKALAGRAIGAAEKAAGVPSAMDIQSTPMNLGQKSIGEYINDAVNSVKDSGGQGAPEYWLRMKDQLDRIYKLGKTSGLTNLDNQRLAGLRQMVQAGLNNAVPGRAGPAASFANAMTVPNAVSSMGKAISKIPWWAKVAGATTAGVTGIDSLKHALGGGR